MRFASGPLVVSAGTGVKGAPRNHNSSVDAMLASSRDGGRTFGSFEPVHADAAVSDYPSVVALPGDSTVRVFWHGKAGDDPARAIFGTVSHDGAKTFAPVERQVSGASVVDPAWNELMPTTYVLDPQGRTVHRLQGGKHYEEFARVLEELEPCRPRGAAAG
jgi:hypothetical protein